MSTTAATSAGPSSMQRRLGLTDAIVIGMGSMIGAGVFSVWAPASRTTPVGWLVVAVLIASVVAFANATSSAQLAARYPVAGGSYVYGREELGPWFGFAAGWCFVIGKTASCAAMAMTFAGYVLPAGSAPWLHKVVGIVAVALLTWVNCLGVTRTARLTRIIVTIVLLVLAVFCVTMAFVHPVGATEGPASIPDVPAASVWGVLQSAGLIFFAFAGYARIATMGEEVRDPARTIPRAIVVALAATVVVYLLIAVTLWRIFRGSVWVGDRRVLPDWPLAEAAHRWASGLVAAQGLLVALGVAAALATAGALLNLMTGIGRTTLAMAREHDAPTALAALHPRTGVPHRAEILLGVIVSIVVALVDLRGAIGFSSFAVLLYYTVANLAALRQSEGRRYPRALQVLGVVLCLVLVVTLPWQSSAVGLAVLAVGLLVRLIARSTAPRRGSSAR
ncbi:APC family permease [Aestuariimicrobium soli]|uniref:APC family permease n=1 Tax=Aestuariimicrobium soli TaxID=2035834 RepID=UPI003EC1474A